MITADQACILDRYVNSNLATRTEAHGNEKHNLETISKLFGKYVLVPYCLNEYGKDM